METSPKKSLTSKEENEYPEKDEIPPDSDIKNQYKEKFEEKNKEQIDENVKKNKKENNQKYNENKSNQEIQFKDNKGTIKKIKVIKINQKEINEKNNEIQIYNEEKQKSNQIIIDDNQNIINQKNNIYPINQINQEYILSQEDQYLQNQEYQNAVPNQLYQNNQEYQYTQQFQENPYYLGMQSGEVLKTIKVGDNSQYIIGKPYIVIKGGENPIYQMLQPSLEYQILQHFESNINNKKRQIEGNQKKIHKIIKIEHVPSYENQEIKYATTNHQKYQYQINNQMKETKINQVQYEPNNEINNINYNYQKIENQVTNKYNNNFNPMAQFRKGIHKISSKKTENKKIIKKKNSQPKDNISKTNIQSKTLKNSFFSKRFKKKPIINQKLVSFKSISRNRLDLDSNFDKKNLTEYIEIPREEYEAHSNVGTIFLERGMETGKYKFKGKEENLKEKDILPEKVNLSEEEILNEIKIRSTTGKSITKKFEILEKYFSLTDLDRNLMSQNELEAYEKEIRRIYGANKKKLSEIIHSRHQSQPEFKNKLKNKNEKIQTFDKNIKNKKINFQMYSDLSLTPMDNYSKYIFEQINKIRIDPQSFIGVIEDAKANIIRHRYGGYIYSGKIKIALAEGETVFDEAIEYLKNTESMGKLEFCPQLTVELPKNEREIKDKDDLRLKVEEMIINGINIKSYWRDLIKDPEISFLLMIVDDNGTNKGKKRRDILNPNIKYIGISSIEINNKFVCYITLSSKLE